MALTRLALTRLLRRRYLPDRGRRYRRRARDIGEDETKKPRVVRGFLVRHYGGALGGESPSCRPLVRP